VIDHTSKYAFVFLQHFIDIAITANHFGIRTRFSNGHTTARKLELIDENGLYFFNQRPKNTQKISMAK